MTMHRRWLILVCVCNVWAGAALADPGRQIVIEAHDYDRGNVHTSLPGQVYAGKFACIWNGGQYPNQADYVLDLPVTAEYTLHVLYTAAESRPVDILIDGQKACTGVAGVTGDWNTDRAQWEKQCAVRLAQGQHTITLQRQDCLPHICALRLESSEPFPEGWQLNRPGPEERRQREAQRARLLAGLAALELIDPVAIRRALEDLAASFPQRFFSAGERNARLDEIDRRKAETRRALESGDEAAPQQLRALQTFVRETLLANPLIDFDRLLIVRRGTDSPALGLPQNWQGNCALPRNGFRDEIAILSLAAPDAEPARLYRPADPVFVGDVDLNFDADKLLFSSIGTNNCWQVFELAIDGTRLRQVTPGLENDVDNYDACYLPDGRIIFSSTSSFTAVPCVNGSTRVANLFLMNSDGGDARQLCFDQEHNWCPTVANDGRVLYTRWEYTDTPHTHSRLLFQMNPDGTQQQEVYGSNSYWPNAMFYTRPIPGSASKVVTVVGGHHGVPRMGELVILDTARSRREAEGVVQRIPGYGKKVEALIEDQLVDNSWPKFLHPYPLSEKYFLVACQPTAQSLWGVYLVDIFDNIVLIKEEPGWALLEPVPVRRVPRPPVKPDTVDLRRDDCTVYLADIYAGPGLAGIPRGTVKKLRVFSYTYDYPGMGGPQGVVGMEGPWDIRRILGTVPVEADGSAAFRAPANTPISIQPLDAEGRALQLMRSWFTGMPGEKLSCVGCHEQHNAVTPNGRTAASFDRPCDITPWYGPARGFSYQREVQPVVDKYCVGCHDGQPGPQGQAVVDLRGTEMIHDYDSRYHHGGQDAGKFSVGYANLQRFVRRPGLESDYHLLTPMEFHVTTTELYQLLRKGHHGVQLDDEAWDRLVTWIDLNAPYHGSWLTISGKERVAPVAERRRQNLRQFAGVDVDLEWTGPELAEPPEFVRPEPAAPVGGRHEASIETKTAAVSGSAAANTVADDVAGGLQRAAGSRCLLDLGNGVQLSLVRVPAGEFVMGSTDGHPDEFPPTRQRVESFWVGQFEITNQQYAQFDPYHDSRHEIRHGMQFGVQGWPLNQPQQPVVRVSWHQAMAFCNWLDGRVAAGQVSLVDPDGSAGAAEPARQWKLSGFTLPTEAQWEYACRAGAATLFSFGDRDADFSPYANLADMKLRDAVSHPYLKENVPLADPSKYDDWIPRDTRFNDAQLVSAAVGQYRPNAWGLYDMHGNVWEWTQSAMRPYPYRADDGRNATDGDQQRVVRGGSWRDRPERCGAAFRLAYQPYQRVYNVGFRVVCTDH